MDQRINYAYRSNHETALAAKTLIRLYYGQKEKFSYFVGCSEGGRQALMEAERFPEDFDGIAAGAPAILNTIHNSFFHGWEWHVNRRTDGSIILVQNRLALLHQVMMQHCAVPAGLSAGIDGNVLQEPTACTFNPSWILCKTGLNDASSCFTREEVDVVERLYDGPADSSGRRLEMGGLPPGSEDKWQLSTSGHPADPQTKPGRFLKTLLLPPESDADAASLDDSFAFTLGWFAKLRLAAPLYNAANTNLRRFKEHGGKLIIWHGGADIAIQPSASIAYYQGVQREMGVSMTDQFTKLFILPGVGHCGGGDGPSQLDVLSPLMTWTELHRAPEELIVGAVANKNAFAGNRYPYSLQDEPARFTRPVFPFPFITRYGGTGDEKAAASYSPVNSKVLIPQRLETEANSLIAPDNQKSYVAHGGTLITQPSK
jgi:feruloyl esterase